MDDLRSVSQNLSFLVRKKNFLKVTSPSIFCNNISLDCGVKLSNTESLLPISVINFSRRLRSSFTDPISPFRRVLSFFVPRRSTYSSPVRSHPTRQGSCTCPCLHRYGFCISPRRLDLLSQKHPFVFPF